MRRFLARLALLLLPATAALAQQTVPEYFPLQPGNQWVYRSAYFSTFRTVSVTETRQFNDLTYSVVLQNSEPGTAVYLRSDGAGRIFTYDTAKQQETLAYDFTGRSSQPNLNGTSSTVSPADHYSGPIGDYDNAFTITQRGSVSGSSETFVPWIGKVGGSTFLTGGSSSLVPPLVEDLIYARINNVLLLTTREWSISLALDRPIYRLQFGQTDDCQGSVFPNWKPAAGAYEPCALARLTLRLAGTGAAKLSFPTSQLYEMELRDPAGKVIWRYSDGKAFAQAVRELVVNPGELNFTQLVPLYNADAFPRVPLAPGAYRLTATLLDADGGSGSASVLLRIIP